MRERFSSPKILELKTECDLVSYGYDDDDDCDSLLKMQVYHTLFSKMILLMVVHIAHKCLVISVGNFAAD